MCAVGSCDVMSACRRFEFVLQIKERNTLYGSPEVFDYPRLDFLDSIGLVSCTGRRKVRAEFCCGNLLEVGIT